MKQKKHIILVILVFIVIAIQLFFSIGSKSIEDYTSTIIASSLVYLILIYVLFKVQIKKSILVVTLFCLFIPKVFFIPITPIGSDDYYRYLWDGKVYANGINPYLYAPNDSKLKSLHSSILPERVNYPEIKTIYFPVSQLLFKYNYLLNGEETIILKLFYLFFDLVIICSLFFLLRKFLIDLKYLLIYAAIPLVNYQFYIDAHIDIVGAALMLSSISFYFYNKKLLSLLLLGLSVSVKPTGFLLLPFLFQNEIGIKNKIQATVLPLLIFLITFLPYLFEATPIDTFINYTIKWTFNGMIYNAISIFISDNIIIRSTCAIIYIFILAFLYFSKMELISKIYLALFLLLLLSPVVHPWYLFWIVVLLPIVRSYSGIYYVSSITVTFITVIAYQNTGVWKEHWEILLLQYIPVLVLLLIEIYFNKFKFLFFEQTNKY